MSAPDLRLLNRLENNEAKDLEQDGRINDLERRVSGVENGQGNQDNAIADNQARLTDLDQRVNGFERDLQDVGAVAGRADGKADKALGDAAAADGKADQAIRDAAAAGSAAEAAQTSVDNAQSTADQAQTDAADARSKAEQALQDLGTLEDRVDVLNRDVGTNTRNISDVQQSLQNIRDQVGGIEDRVDALDRDVGTNSRDISDLRGSLSGINTRLDRAETRISDLQTQLDAIDVRGAIQEELSGFKTQFADLQNAGARHLNDMVGDINAASSELTQARTDWNNAQIHFNETTDQLKNVRPDLAANSFWSGVLDTGRAIGNTIDGVFKLLAAINKVQVASGDIREAIPDVASQLP